ncbi:CHAT domain-containing protein [Streptomyces sp. SHP 1-2]|uniref:CHAT domain-containing protein n=1 Tax=Streptomyces sp. SHP 1-2 TaxID=2769489 RepID=UPI002237F50C|nr:CHAT domain-containing protein [Streptomyces sp. SHP 1-2]MCW5254299.1 CHAT domain-containing protein [Streptomyces sp. SHP 1-2]
MTDTSRKSPPDRARAVLDRIADCTVPPGSAQYTGPRGAELDELVGELGSLADGFAGDEAQASLRELLKARLGVLLGIRYVLNPDGKEPYGGGEHEDPDLGRARELLDRARQSELLGREDRATARRNLLRLLASRLVWLQERMRTLGVADARGVRLRDVEWAGEVGRPRDQGGTGIVEDTVFLVRLLQEDPEGELTTANREMLDLFAATMHAAERNDMRTLLTLAQRVLRNNPGAPSLLGHLVGSVAPALASSLPGGVLPSGPEDGDGTGPNATATGTGAGAGTGAATGAGLDALWELLAFTEAMTPGTLEPGEVPRLISTLTGRPDPAAPDLASPEPPPLSGRMVAALTHLNQATRTGDLTGMNSALALLHEAFGAGEFDQRQSAEWLLPVVAGTLIAASMTGGSLQDVELAESVLGDLDRALLSDGSPDKVSLQVNTHVVRLLIALQRAMDDQDPDGIESVLLDLHDLDDAVPDGGPWLRVLISYALGTASLALALHTQALLDLRTAMHHFEQVLDTDVEIPALQTMMDASWAPLLSMIALVEQDPDRITAGIARSRTALERPGATFDFEARVRLGIAHALDTLHGLTGDPEALDQAVEELVRARSALPADSPGEASVHATLARRLAARAATAPGTPAGAADLRDAVAAARDALRATTDDVLLQSGVRHGLRMARQEADLGCTAALWALEAGDAGEAVGCVEAGRSLVLRAAAVSVGVAERLEALDAHDLAKRWRAATRSTAGRAGPGHRSPAGRTTPDGPDGAGGAGGAGGPRASALAELLSDASGGGPALPGDVRRRSLALLRGRERPADEPAERTVSALRAGLVRSRADALIHLVPGSGTRDGALLLVTPEGPVRALVSPSLSAAGRGPVAEYLAAGAAWQRLEAAGAGVSDRERHGAERAWSEALDALCDWAGGVLAPALGELGLWDRALCESGLRPCPGGPDRPAGGTGRPADAEPDAGSAGAPLPPGARPSPGIHPAPLPGTGPAARHEALAPPAHGGSGCAPVRLVLVPCGELGVVPWQAAEVGPLVPSGGSAPVRLCEVAVVTHAASGREFLRAAARRRMPPAGRPVLVFHGYDLTWAEEEVEILRDTHYPHAEVLTEDEGRPPTPEAVLALLDGGGGPAASLVHLACHGLAGPDPAASALRLAAPGPDEAEGADLTLSALLDRPAAEADRAAGPLVVCSACETDLTTRDHDEALTVASVLVHRLAADAIGSRWRVPDRGSEILMLVLHDRLAAGLAPPDALRAAQRWMLAPPERRGPVAGLRALSGRPPARHFRDRPEAWAAFVHQGNPAPAGPLPTALEATS